MSDYDSVSDENLIQLCKDGPTAPYVDELLKRHEAQLAQAHGDEQITFAMGEKAGKHVLGLMRELAHAQEAILNALIRLNRLPHHDGWTEQEDENLDKIFSFLMAYLPDEPEHYARREMTREVKRNLHNGTSPIEPDAPEGKECWQCRGQGTIRVLRFREGDYAADRECDICSGTGRVKL